MNSIKIQTKFEIASLYTGTRISRLMKKWRQKLSLDCLLKIKIAILSKAYILPAINDNSALTLRYKQYEE
jgi:hypothetical protein